VSQFGHNRERQLVDLLADEDWIAFRAPGSLGCVDVVALKDGRRPRMIECKATAAGPYAGFLPADRKRLSETAKLAGADAWLYWHPKRAKGRWIAEHEWPDLPRRLNRS
jgi:Holliday junction resolvase